MRKARTLDEIAVCVMLSDRPKAEQQRFLKSLSDKVADVVANRVACPECGNKGPHEDNGDSRDLSLCCTACGTHFDAPTGITVEM